MVQITTVDAPNDQVDPEFYRAYYADMAAASDADILRHWEKHGRDEGRLPNEQLAEARYQNHPALPADFTVQGYLDRNPDVAAKVRWPFEAIDHFLRLGQKENRKYKAEPDRDPAPTAQQPSQSPREEALLFADFDADFYRLFYPDMATATDEKCQKHWLSFGREEGRHPNFNAFIDAHENRNALDADFSLTAYVRKNPDLLKKLEDPRRVIAHYLKSGLAEGRDGTPDKISSRFIKDYYGLRIDPNLPPRAVENHIRNETSLSIEVPIFLCADDLVAWHLGISSELVEIFNHEDYIYGNGDLAITLDPTNFAAALEHFLTIGRHHAATIAYTHGFDEKFYAEQYYSALPKPIANEVKAAQISDQPLPRQVLYDHWLTDGLAHNMHPNLIVWVENELEISAPSRLPGDLITYRHFSSDLTKMKKPSEFLTHFIKHGIFEDRPGVVYNLETAPFFYEAAIEALKTGNQDHAVRILTRILQTAEGFPLAAHELADRLLSHGFFKQAIDLYNPLAESATGSQWTYINLSKAFEGMGNEVGAVETLRRGAQSFPEDVNLQGRVEKATTHFFPIILKKARIKSVTDGIDAAQDYIRAALPVLGEPQFAPIRDCTSRTVTIVGNHDLQQCRFYRIDQKVEHLETAGYKVQVFRHTENLDRYFGNLEQYLAVFFYRVPSTPIIAEAIRKANIHGIPTFYEIDDLLFEEALFPPPLETYAGQITAEQHGGMAVDVPRLKHAMQFCQYGVASTRSLAEAMQPYIRSGKVFVHKNAFGTLHTRMANTPMNRDDDRITIFYGSGTKAHKDDFHEVLEPAFERLAQKYGDRIRFFVLGYLTMTDRLKALGDALHIQEPVWDTEDYWTLLRDNADINLAVLSPSPVTDAKSEIKWLEAGMFGIPSVVSKTATHVDVIKDGETGILAETSDDFFQAISNLIDDSDKRLRIGDAARKVALESYSIKAQADNIDRILNEATAPAKRVRKKKIAIVNVFYPPQAIGGATRVVADNVSDLIEEFGDQFDVTVFTTRNGLIPYESTAYVHDGVRVTAVATDKDPDIEKRIVDPQMAIEFNRFLDREQPDLIHFHCIQRLTTSIVSQARLRQIPYIITAHDGWWISDAQFLVDENDAIDLYHYGTSDAESPQPERARAFRKDLLGANAICAVSEPFAEIYRSTGLSNVVALENGVSVIEPAKRVASENGKIRLAHIGGMSRHKGYHLVRHALVSSPEFTNLELTVIDHARTKGSVGRDLWGSTPVTFLPKVPQNEIASLFARIDVLLAPSIWPESYGLVTREALLCGCRVIASDRGSIGTCIDHGENGLVIDVSTANGLKMALAEVDANPEFFRDPPRNRSILRPAREQARDLAQLYAKILDDA